jgi:hypothetical protein
VTRQGRGAAVGKAGERRAWRTWRTREMPRIPRRRALRRHANPRRNPRRNPRLVVFVLFVLPRLKQYPTRLHATLLHLPWRPLLPRSAPALPRRHPPRSRDYLDGCCSHRFHRRRFPHPLRRRPPRFPSTSSPGILQLPCHQRKGVPPWACGNRKTFSRIHHTSPHRRKEPRRGYTDPGRRRRGGSTSTMLDVESTGR